MLARRDLLLVLTLALTLAAQVEAGAIIGGREAAPHTRPYMVLLTLINGGNNDRICSGFLLNENFVLTAAHCSAKTYKVSLGVHNLHNKGFQVTSVAQTFPHRDYDNNNYKNDIMLLKLSSKAIFNKNVAPIALADVEDVSGPKSCLVSGWGKTDTQNNFSSPVLREVEVQLVSDPECDKRNFYCSEGKNGPFQGDSGGPLVCDGKAHGVFSNVVGTEHRIHCFVKIPLCKTWIDSTMKKALDFSAKSDD
ncbi:uncharacterized protein ACO6RY_18425 [Pungitius sinensis]